MKILIDCFKLVKGTGKSIGIYNLTRNLVENLAKECSPKNSGTKGKNKIIILGTKYNKEDFDLPGVKFVSVKYNPHNKIICVLWELYLVTLALKKIRPDKVLFPRGFAPLQHTVEEYVIIHDMIPFYYHKNYYGVLNPLENFYIRWRLKASIKACDGVLTDSFASKQDIVQWSKVKTEKVHVVYPGQNHIQSEEAAGEGDYICAITSYLPHKNAKGIIESYIKYYNKSEHPLSLKIIGLEDTETFFVPDEIKEKITCYKYLKEDTEMHSLMKQSRIFLFLSYIEGFGFPPLEAMQLGVPVICSGVSSVPEVVGDAAILVDPDDTDQVAEELLKLEKDKKLCKQYISKGYDNTKRFLWENCIRGYQAILFNMKDEEESNAFIH